MEQNEIYKIYGKNYKEMTRKLLEASGLSDRIVPGQKIGIKPNLVSPTPAEYGATTHPEVIEGIIEYLKAHGHENLLILEGSWIGDKTSEAYEYCGYRALCEKYDVPFADTQKDGSYEKDCDGMSLRICSSVKDIDFMINVPVMKGHGQTKITCALKNMKGLIPNGEKRHFHTMGLHKPIAHLSRGIRQDFIVIDHICGDLCLEDGGHPVQTDCVMTALDPVLVDSYVCHLLGFSAEDVEYIGLAGQLGSGCSDLSKGKITVFSNEDSEKMPHGIKTFPAFMEDESDRRRSPSDQLLEISYAIEDADSCSACYASLAPVLLRLKEEGLYEKLMRVLPGKIAIGQGFRGEKGKIGIGRCCEQFEINIPGCPPEENDVYFALISLLK